MKRLISFFGVILLGALFIVTPANAKSIPNWSLEGTHLLDLVCTSGCSRTYFFAMDITSQDLKTGDFSGTGFWWPNPAYLWDVTGKIKGSNLTMTIVYTRPGISDTYTFQGTIDKRGAISGTAAGVGATFDWTTTLVVDLPSEKAQCKKDGWQTFINPIFKNQGDCVGFLESNQ